MAKYTTSEKNVIIIVDESEEKSSYGSPYFVMKYRYKGDKSWTTGSVYAEDLRGFLDNGQWLFYNPPVIQKFDSVIFGE